MTSKYEHADNSLWKAFKDGDPKALDTIFRSYYPLLYNYGKKIVHDEELIEDCLQDFFLYIYEHRHHLKDLDNIKPYLFKAFRNRFIKNLKQKEKHLSLTNLANEALPVQFGIEEIMIEQETISIKRELLHKLLNNLPKRQRELIYLKYYQQLSVKEIAEVASISYQGVLNGLSKSLKKLREAVKVY